MPDPSGYAANLIETVFFTRRGAGIDIRILRTPPFAISPARISGIPSQLRIRRTCPTGNGASTCALFVMSAKNCSFRRPPSPEPYTQQTDKH
ncbi:MAG: hypothetical protein APR53_06640 [Methanoculleus sp. SDB]|nr:MAG: hypothetical protein APR53_06640 [Methanoculleus sp. SDB]